MNAQTRESLVAPVAAADPTIARHAVVQRAHTLLDDLYDDANRRGESLDLGTFTVTVKRQRATGALRVLVTCDVARPEPPDPTWTPGRALDTTPLIPETERRDLA